MPFNTIEKFLHLNNMRTAPLRLVDILPRMLRVGLHDYRREHLVGQVVLEVPGSSEEEDLVVGV